MKVTIPVEAGNRTAKDGTMGSIIGSILQDMKPEAAYFLTENGRRTAHVYFEMEDANRIPAVAEPWFLAFDATVEIQPVMIPEDLANASEDIATAVQTYSR